MAFQIAGSMGFKQAVREARPQLLEPIMKMEITIPENYMFGVKPVSEISEYDTKTQSMNVTGQTMHFPVPPTHFMVFVVEKEQTVDVGGKLNTKQMADEVITRL